MNKGFNENAETLVNTGAPRVIRTPDLRIRRQAP